MRFRQRFGSAATKSFIALGVASAFSAALEATVLVTLVPLAATIASNEDAYRGEVLGRTLEVSIGQLLAMTVALILVRAVARAATAWMVARIPARFEASQRRLMFEAFLDARWSLQATEQGGHLQETVTTSVQQATVSLASACMGLVSFFGLMMMMVASVLLNPVATVGIVVALVGLFFGMRPLSRLARRRSGEQRDLNLEYAHGLSQAVSMAREIKIFNGTPEVKREVQVLVRRSRRNRFVQYFLVDLVPAMYQSAALLLVVSGLGFVWWIDVKEITTLAPIVLLLIRALSYSQSIQGTYHKFEDAAPFREAIRERMRILQEAREVDTGKSLESARSVAFSGVSFSYIPGKDVLRNVSCAIAHGEAVGIVGPSGAGKSTFIQLLLRLREPTSGRMLVNDEPASAFSLSSWFDCVGYVPQEPALLNATVKENIRFYRPGISEEAIIRAARLAHVHDEILAWPRGYETMVGERGADVSGGQRQRLCIARALLTQPDLLIFDEPTSALDPHSESLIQTTMRDLHGAVTLVIVAHRMSTLNICDRIMVLSDGDILAFDQRHIVARDNEYYSNAVRLSQLA